MFAIKRKTLAPFFLVSGVPIIVELPTYQRRGEKPLPVSNVTENTSYCKGLKEETSSPAAVSTDSFQRKNNDQFDANFRDTLADIKTALENLLQNFTRAAENHTNYVNGSSAGTEKGRAIALRDFLLNVKEYQEEYMFNITKALVEWQPFHKWPKTTEVHPIIFKYNEETNTVFLNSKDATIDHVHSACIKGRLTLDIEIIADDVVESAQYRNETSVLDDLKNRLEAATSDCEGTIPVDWKPKWQEEDVERSKMHQIYETTSISCFKRMLSSSLDRINKVTKSGKPQESLANEVQKLMDQQKSWCQSLQDYLLHFIENSLQPNYILKLQINSSTLDKHKDHPLLGKKETKESEGDDDQ